MVFMETYCKVFPEKFFSAEGDIFLIIWHLLLTSGSHTGSFDQFCSEPRDKEDCVPAKRPSSTSKPPCTSTALRQFCGCKKAGLPFGESAPLIFQHVAPFRCWKRPSRPCPGHRKKAAITCEPLQILCWNPIAWARPGMRWNILKSRFGCNIIHISRSQCWSWTVAGYLVFLLDWSMMCFTTRKSSRSPWVGFPSRAWQGEG